MAAAAGTAAVETLEQSDGWSGQTACAPSADYTRPSGPSVAMTLNSLATSTFGGSPRPSREWGDAVAERVVQQSSERCLACKSPRLAVGAGDLASGPSSAAAESAECLM